jgi:multimeric flavodoxin WrbA
MFNILLISGSPREGNTDYILNKVFETLDSSDKEIIYLREKNISHCKGCLSCDKTNKCMIRDDMDELLEKLKAAEVIILGTPNYFSNVPGLVKDFIDRTNPFYETAFLKSKKIYAIVVGGEEEKYSERVVNNTLKPFTDAHGMDLVGSVCFQALKTGEVEKDLTVTDKIYIITNLIKNI